MEEHKLLTGMLLAALVFSVVGTVVTVEKIGGLGITSDGLTAAATATGSGSATVATDITISVSDSTIDFGEGALTGGSTYDLLITNGSNHSTNIMNTAAVGENSTWNETIVDNITIVNDGNAKLNLSVNFSKTNGTGAGSYICDGSCPGAVPESAGLFAYQAYEHEPSACTTGARPFQDIGPTSEDYDVCTCMGFQDGQDELALTLAVIIPQGAPAGAKTTTITFISSTEGTGGC